MLIRRLMVNAVAICCVFGVIMVCSTTANAQKTVVLEGTITGKKKLKKNINYLLRGGVFITKKLIVKPGATIFGLPGSFLVINQGAKIDAQGTIDLPIVFTSAAPAGTRRRGDWGGLIINGRAPINVPGGTAQGEGSTGTYGGGANPDPNDSSGVLSFVRVEYGGFAISPDNELNCVAFQGVGNGTTVEFVQAAFGGDDGFEWFGGTCNAKNLVVTGAVDDSLDWTFGWSGKVQFAVVQQRSEGTTDAGIEADNNENDFTFLPRSHPKIMNMTLVGDPRTTGAQAGTGSTRGILLRRGTAAELRNVVVTAFKNVGIEIRDAETFDQVAADTLTLRGMIFFDNGAGLQTATNFGGATANSIAQVGVKIVQADPLLADPFDLVSPDFRPQAGSPALDPANFEPPFAGDAFFEVANYVGAFDANNDWTLGWTNWVLGN
ncbi:MAG TPA: T9SS C-terminal target domain-containing protein [Blastocatellia bacterium]|nr:T9SS C-terminal target domain-containing protein [Blastocatellia bacterium]